MTNHELLTIDACGTRCPEPIVRLRAGLRAHPDALRVRLLADDPMALIDVPAFCARGGHELISTTESAGKLEFIVQRK